jgi:hypothetical protein
VDWNSVRGRWRIIAHWSRYVGQCPGNDGVANVTRLPEVNDDLIFKGSFGGFGANQDSFGTVARIRQTPSGESAGLEYARTGQPFQHHPVFVNE